MKILLVEDDDLVINLLTKGLTPHHYILDVVKDGETGWTYGSNFEYDLLILDIVLPQLDGISLCQRFRTEGFSTPILMLTGQNTITAKIQGLNAGADDYVVKPFEEVELIARIRALLRRTSATPLPLLSWGQLQLNLSTCEVNFRGQPLSLSAMEYELLEVLLRDSQHVFSIDELIDRLWSSDEFPTEATVRSHIRRLRRKLVSVGAPKNFIANVRGRGYYLNAPAPEASEMQGPHLNQSLLNQSQTLNAPPIQPYIGTPCKNSNHSADLSQNQTHTNQAHSNQIHSSTLQSQYQSFLDETWVATKAKSIDQLEIVSQAVQDLRLDQISEQQLKQAQQSAHKLAGNLGFFGLMEPMQAARQLELWLHHQDGLHQDRLQPEQGALMTTMVKKLQLAINDPSSIQSTPLFEEKKPLLLIVSSDAQFNQALVTAAAIAGISVECIATVEESTILSLLEGHPNLASQQPDAVLFPFPADSGKPTNFTPVTAIASNPSKLWQLFAHLYPDASIVVSGDFTALSDRLKVMHWGGQLLIEAQSPPGEIIAAITQFLQRQQREQTGKKIMILDQDHNWLRNLPTLLKPWGFKVTTLDNPSQFWAVLQSIAPDALVVDANMPDVNGMEICQLIRCDPDWHRLPVLLLSSAYGPEIQRQAFNAGADDLLCKPIMGRALANRVLNRLQRSCC